MAIYCYSCLAEASVTAFGIGQRLLRLFATNPPIRRPPPTESQVHFCLFVGLSCCHKHKPPIRTPPLLLANSSLSFVFHFHFHSFFRFVSFRMVHSVLLAALAFGPAFVSIKQIPLSANECTCSGRWARAWLF